MAVRTEKQQANSVHPQCGLALWERLICKVTTGVLGLTIGKSGLAVAVADFGFSLKLFIGHLLGDDRSQGRQLSAAKAVTLELDGRQSRERFWTPSHHSF